MALVSTIRVSRSRMPGPIRSLILSFVWAATQSLMTLRAASDSAKSTSLSPAP